LRAAATRRLSRRSPQRPELPSYEKCPLTRRHAGAERPAARDPLTAAHPWATHATCLRRGQPKARLAPDRLNFSVLKNKEKP
jgi:hypothetical protein